MMHVPKLVLESADKMIALFVVWVLTNIHITGLIEYVPTISPAATTLKYIRIEEAVDTVLMKREEMKVVPFLLMCDKVKGEKRRDGASFINIVP